MIREQPVGSVPLVQIEDMSASKLFALITARTKLIGGTVQAAGTAYTNKAAFQTAAGLTNV